MRHASLAALVAAGLLAGPAGAAAQDYAAGRQYVIDLGAGVVAKPRYPGADKYILLPYPLVEVSRAYVPFVGQTEKGKAGVFIFPSFGFNGDRKPSDDNSLAGTKKIPWTIEAGLGVGYRTQRMRSYVSLRQAFNGSDGQVGGAGIDLLTPLTPRAALAIGPRVTFASNDYMDTYFGVTAKEAAAGTLTKYNPDGGFKSVGVALSATYALTDMTRFHLRGGYERLIGEAGDSPVAKAGSRDQWMVGAGITYRLGFDLFQ